MLGTFVGIIAAIIFAVASQGTQVSHDFQPVYWILTIVGSLFLYMAFSAKAAVWINLQRTEEDSFPYVQELFLGDRALSFSMFSLFVFALFSYCIALAFSVGIDGGIVHGLLVLWIALSGVAFDVMRFDIRRMMRYSYYEFLLNKVTKQCLQFVEKGREKDAFDWLDGLIETACKSTRKGSAHVASYALEQILVLVEGYVGAASKSLRAYPALSSQTSLLDRVNYLSVYVCKRFEWIFRCALAAKMDTVAEEVIGVFGKMSLYLIKYHPTLAHVPLLFIEKCAKMALESNFEDVVVRANATLSELTKNYVAMATEKKESLKAITLTALSHLEEIVKATFQKNRETSPALLMQPFAEIGQMMGDAQFQEFPDRDAILQELRRILNQFSALDLIKQKIELPK